MKLFKENPYSLPSTINCFPQTMTAFVIPNCSYMIYIITTARLNIPTLTSKHWRYNFTVEYFKEVSIWIHGFSGTKKNFLKWTLIFYYIWFRLPLHSFSQKQASATSLAPIYFKMYQVIPDNLLPSLPPPYHPSPVTYETALSEVVNHC